MTISIKSRKAKARILQNWVAAQIGKLLNIPYGYEDDKEIKPRLMGDNGPDVILSDYAADLFQFRNIECKSAERWNILQDIAQIKKREKGFLKASKWLLFLKCKKIKSPIVILDAKAFFKLLENCIEIWKPIPEFEELYEISNFGNIRTYYKKGNYKEKFLTEPYELSPCIDKYYKYVLLHKNGQKYKIAIHRLVLLTFIGKPENEKMQGSHKNGDSLDNRLINLCWESSKDNTNRKYNHGTMFNIPSGEKHHNSKLLKEDIKEIRNIYKMRGITQKELSIKYNTTISNINKILKNKAWKDYK